MRNELGLLNAICIIVALLFVVLAVLNAILSGDFLTTDNLFITLVCLVMALMFAVNPSLYLKSTGKLPVPFKRGSREAAQQLAAGGPALLDSKGRPVPPDVRNMVARFRQPQQKDV